MTPLGYLLKEWIGMAKASKKVSNPCPLDELIKALAKELGVTKDVARYIYDTMGAVIIELLEEYDSIKVLPMMKIERYNTLPRRMKNLQTGEIECSVPREKLYGNVLENYDSMEKAQVVVEKHEEQKRMQELYEQQLEHERQLALEEEKARKEELQKERLKRSKVARRKKAQEKRRAAVIRQLKAEGLLDIDYDHEAHRRELNRRKRGKKIVKD